MTFLYNQKYTGGQGKEMLSKSSLVNSEGHTHTAYGVVHANHVILCVLFFRTYNAQKIKRYLSEFKFVLFQNTPWRQTSFYRTHTHTYIF